MVFEIKKHIASVSVILDTRGDFCYYGMDAKRLASSFEKALPDVTGLFWFYHFFLPPGRPRKPVEPRFHIASGFLSSGPS